MASFLSDDRGGVGIMTALALPGMIGMAGLAIEYGNGLLERVRSQRIADAAAYAGAVAFNATGSAAAMQTAAAHVGRLNGIASGVAATLGASPSGNGNQAVSVTVSTAVPLVLARVLGSERTLPVRSNAAAEIASGQPGCIYALSATGTGVTLAGGTRVTATGCAIASNTTATPSGVSVPCGTFLTTRGVTYAAAAPSSAPCGGLTAPDGRALSLNRATTPDPLAGDATVAALRSRLPTAAAMADPPAPGASGGGNIEFGWNQSATQAAATAAGCSASMAGSSWTLTCAGSVVTFANVTTGGGITVNFNTGGAASTTYNISGSIVNTATAMSFGPGTWNIGGGIVSSGGGPMSFARGTFNIGRPGTACGGTSGYSICNTSSGTLSIAGPSIFALRGGYHGGGGSRATLGGGTGNSYRFGQAVNGRAINVEGGAQLTMYDATGGLFEAGGSIVTAGGTCLTTPAAAQHDVKGSIEGSGAVSLGGGVWTVTGSIGFGVSGGGDVGCDGGAFGVRGVAVTLVTGGSPLLGGGCSGQVFCLAAGYRTVNLSAPAGGARLLLVGPAGGSAGARFTEGASGTTLSGTFYLPNGAVTLSGGAGVGGGAGDCLTLIGSQVALTGGAVLASDCTGGAGATRRVVLVR